MIFPVFGSSDLQRPARAIDRGKEGASLVGSAPPFPWKPPPLADLRPPNPSSGLADCPGHSGNKGRATGCEYSFAESHQRRLGRILPGFEA